MRNFYSHSIISSDLAICGGMVVYRGWFGGSCDNDTEG